jgi:4-hydroxy-tetrahydrodipicolinate synthase
MSVDYAKSDAKHAAREAFTGIWAAITTPFDASGEVDHRALENDIDYLTGALNVGGIFCAGVMGEFWALTNDERARAVETVVAACHRRCPVLAHTGHHSARDTIELTRQAQDAGADFAVVISPYYPAGFGDGLHAWYMEVLDAVDIGVWLFDTRYAGVSLPLDLIHRLADVDNVCGIKVGHDHQRYLDVLDKVGDRILVCEPSEATWLENIRDHGQSVYMSSASPFLYQTADWQPMNEYTRRALGGDYAGAEAISATLAPIRELHKKWTHGPSGNGVSAAVPAIKAWSGLLGLSGGKVRPPLESLTGEQLRSLAADLESVGLVR